MYAFETNETTHLFSLVSVMPVSGVPSGLYLTVPSIPYSIDFQMVRFIRSKVVPPLLLAAGIPHMQGLLQVQTQLFIRLKLSHSIGFLSAA